TAGQRTFRDRLELRVPPTENGQGKRQCDGPLPRAGKRGPRSAESVDDRGSSSSVIPENDRPPGRKRTIEALHADPRTAPGQCSRSPAHEIKEGSCRLAADQSPLARRDLRRQGLREQPRLSQATLED